MGTVAVIFVSLAAAPVMALSFFYMFRTEKDAKSV